MTGSHDLLEQASVVLGAVAAAPMVMLADEDLCEVLALAERAGRYLDTVRALAAAEVEERSRYELGRGGLAQRLGHSRGAHLVEFVTRVSQAEATRRVRLGSAIRQRTALDGSPLPASFPVVAAAMTAGTMGTDAASCIIRCLSSTGGRAMPAALDSAEQALAEAALTEPADLVAVRARVWREALDPDGATPRDEQLRERRAFHLGRERDGMTPFSGVADPISAALLRAALGERTGPRVKPRFLDLDEQCGEQDPAESDAGSSTPDGDLVTVLSDPRSREQRQFDIVFGLITAGIRSSEGQPGSMRATSTVMAVIQLKDLEAGTGIGWLDDVAEPVSASSVQELACDAGIRRIVLGESGEVLHHGLLKRYFTPAQRRALAVRDGGCVWPQCQAPPGWCHAHHVQEYENDGPTDIDNGVLLCPAHHHMLHASEFTMRMVNGKPRLLAPAWLDPERIWSPLGKSRVTMAA